MNLVHRWLCSSANWKNVVETYILPWTLEGVNMGADLLEIGPGPGVSTDLLCTRVASLTCVEIDRSYADKLRRRAPDSVRVLCEDATRMSRSPTRFSVTLHLAQRAIAWASTSGQPLGGCQKLPRWCDP
jgi:hypothetical protein